MDQVLRCDWNAVIWRLRPDQRFMFSGRPSACVIRCLRWVRSVVEDLLSPLHRPRLYIGLRTRNTGDRATFIMSVAIASPPPTKHSHYEHRALLLTLPKLLASYFPQLISGYYQVSGVLDLFCAGSRNTADWLDKEGRR